MNDRRLTNDPWTSLRRHTSARVALGRAGGSVPTAELLDFAAAHAAARDAVHGVLDVDALVTDMSSFGLPIVRATSSAMDRATYLKRPDLGRSLSNDGRAHLSNLGRDSTEQFDVVFVVSDGLSALAAQRHAAPTLGSLVPALTRDGIRSGPIVVVPLARVGIQDEVGQFLSAKSIVILLGERPGLGSPDSLGAYLVFDPKPGNSDADRNCVSNIRPEGLPPDQAARTLHYLLVESLRRKISGVTLKDERTPMLPGAPSAPAQPSLVD